MYEATEIQHSVEHMRYSNYISLLTTNLYFKNFHFKIPSKKYSQYYQIGPLSKKDMEKQSSGGVL